MRQKIKNFFDNNREMIKFWVGIFLFSFITLAITTNNSFLHATNAWRDANAFFTVGKSMANGAILYKDLFEQKGILLYLIYMLGSLITGKEYYGVFLLEVIFSTIGLFFTYKISRLYVKEDKRCKAITALFWILIITSKAFVYGGSAEEFCFPLFMISIYYFFRHVKGKEMTYRNFRMIGFLAGCVFLIKYNLLAFWFAFMAIIFFEGVFRKEYKKTFLCCINFLVPMLIPFAITNIYMFANDALTDFYENYFWVNTIAYASSRFEQFPYLTRLFLVIMKAILYNPGFVFTILFLCLPIILLHWKDSWKEKIYLIVLLFFTTIGIFLTINLWDYYILPMMFIMIIPFAITLDWLFDRPLGSKIEKMLFSTNPWKRGIICVTSICFVILTTNHTEYFLKSKDEIPLTRFAQIINEEENPTLVNMGGLDVGLYQFADVLPSTYYFEMQYIEYKNFPYIIDTFKEYIKNQETMFIIFYSKDTVEGIEDEYGKITEYYDLVDEDYYENRNIYLFKVKERLENNGNDE